MTKLYSLKAKLLDWLETIFYCSIAILIVYGIFWVLIKLVMYIFSNPDEAAISFGIGLASFLVGYKIF